MSIFCRSSTSVCRIENAEFLVRGLFSIASRWEGRRVSYGSVDRRERYALGHDNSAGRLLEARRRGSPRRFGSPAPDMPPDLNPQATQMADESMVRNLDAQARAIWPQEEPLIRRYALPTQARVLDAGCGTGEISSRLAALFPQAHVLGVDIVDAHLELARSRYAALAPRLVFEHQSIFELKQPDRSFDLTLCRHVLHAIPHAETVLAELARVTRPGGYLHVLAEDYRMLHFQRCNGLDPSDFWHSVPAQFGSATGTDLFIGRNVFSIFARMRLEQIAVNYAIVDTLSTSRETFAAIIEAWRDGYVDSIAQLTTFSRESAMAYFNAMIDNIRDPLGYAAWMIPVVSARIP
jgi:ubiquinone/menaquinone biosynthesis C-methylase UbiE